MRITKNDIAQKTVREIRRALMQKALHTKNDKLEKMIEIKWNQLFEIEAQDEAVPARHLNDLIRLLNT